MAFDWLALSMRAYFGVGASPQAINSIVQVLAMTGLNDEQSKTHGSLIAMGPCFQCRSCDAPIVMSFERLVRFSSCVRVCEALIGEWLRLATANGTR